MIPEPYPLTSGDLRDIAAAVEEVESKRLAANKVLGRIEVIRPDSDGDVIGWIDRFDPADPDIGWGFLPFGDWWER